MKGRLSGILIIGILVLLAIGCTSINTDVKHVSGEMALAADVTGEPVVEVASSGKQLNEHAQPSCAQPNPDMLAVCEQMEKAILASTVRLQVTRWQEVDGQKGELISIGFSHATVKDGGYLVTHNHFGDLPAILRGKGAVGEMVRFSLFRADGDVILTNMSPTELEVVAEDAETLVLKLRGAGSLGFFQLRGIPSARFAEGLTVDLEPETEVAQVDWDGQTSFVTWITVEEITVVDAVPQAILNSYVQVGASGGGVFLNGVHIGNNWFRVGETAGKTGQIVRQYSTAALNSELVAAEISQAAVAHVVHADADSQPLTEPIRHETVLAYQ